MTTRIMPNGRRAPYKVRITGGPSKLDLMLALFDSTFSKPRPVSLEWHETVGGCVASGTKAAPVHINSVKQEDGSGESWVLEGHFSGVAESDWRVEGYYSTKTRSGTVTITQVR